MASSGSAGVHDPVQAKAAIGQLLDEREPGIGVDGRDVRDEGPVAPEVEPAVGIRPDEQVVDVGSVKVITRVRIRRVLEETPPSEQQAGRLRQERRILQVHRPPIENPGPVAQQGEAAVSVGIREDAGVLGQVVAEPGVRGVPAGGDAGRLLLVGCAARR